MRRRISPEAQAMAEALGSLQEELSKTRQVEREGLTAHQQSELWVKVGMGAFGLLITGGLWVIWTSIDSAAEVAGQNSDDIQALTVVVSELVTVNKQQEKKLSSRGDWMEGIDTYSEQSRIKDNEHDAEIEQMQKEIKRLRDEKDGQ